MVKDLCRGERDEAAHVGGADGGADGGDRLTADEDATVFASEGRCTQRRMRATWAQHTIQHGDVAKPTFGRHGQNDNNYKRATW